MTLTVLHISKPTRVAQADSPPEKSRAEGQVSILSIPNPNFRRARRNEQRSIAWVSEPIIDHAIAYCINARR